MSVCLNKWYSIELRTSLLKCLKVKVSCEVCPAGKWGEGTALGKLDQCVNCYVRTNSELVQMFNKF